MKQKFFVGLWISTLLLSTIGVSVHEIYCYCLGERRVTLFVNTEECPAAAAKIDLPECCSAAPKSKSCCTKQEGHAEGIHKKGCTDSSTKYVQLNTDLEPAKTETPFVSIPLFFAEPVPDFHFLIPSGLLASAVCSNKAPPDFLPSLSGRNICIRHQCFLC